MSNTVFIDSAYYENRTCGNTTRAVDSAIQLAFEGNNVIVLELASIEDKSVDKSIIHLENKIRKRLLFEHKMQDGKDYTIKTFTQRIKPPEGYETMYNLLLDLKVPIKILSLIKK